MFVLWNFAHLWCNICFYRLVSLLPGVLVVCVVQSRWLARQLRRSKSVVKQKQYILHPTVNNTGCSVKLEKIKYMNLYLNLCFSFSVVIFGVICSCGYFTWLKRFCPLYKRIFVCHGNCAIWIAYFRIACSRLCHFSL